jgi:hypothetical protein
LKVCGFARAHNAAPEAVAALAAGSSSGVAVGRIRSQGANRGTLVLKYRRQLGSRSGRVNLPRVSGLSCAAVC